MAYGEVGFKQSLKLKRATTINGCVDYGIGRNLLTDSYTHHKQFQSLLLLVEASQADAALPQLLAYLASIHHSRQMCKRSDTSVYGVASDGIYWKFVTITHSGLIKISQQFSTKSSDGTKLILQCLAFVLGTAASQTPNMTLEKGEQAAEVGQGGLYDTAMQVEKNYGDEDD
jgi:hypothetical protein